MQNLLKLLAIVLVPGVVLMINPGQQFVATQLAHSLIVCAIVVISGFCLQRSAGQSWAYTLLSLGVPVGLVVTNIGMIKVIATLGGAEADALRESTWMTQVMATSTTTLLTGGMISALGYSMDGETRGQRYMIVPYLGWTTPLAALIILVLVAVVFTPVKPRLLMDWSVICIIGAVLFSFAILRKSKTMLVRLTEAALYGSIIIVGIGVTWWFRGTNLQSGQIDVQSLLFAYRGLFLGGLIYLSAYFVSYSRPPDAEFDVGRMNWHLLEINAFMFFLALAPVSLSEIIR